MPINPLFIKLGLLIASIIGAFFMGYRSASIAVHGQWDKEKAQNNAQAAQIIADANAKVLAAERQASQRIAAIGALYETKLKEQNHAKNNLDRLNASGGLFINAILPGYCNAPNQSPATARLGDGATRIRLSESDGRFLIQFAADADQVANQLAQCQGVITSDREIK